jgi:outer membrane immunogenic protein
MSKRLPFASALLVSTALMASAASAADIIEEPPPIFSWSGFYIGAHAGVVFGQDQNNGCGAFTDLVDEHGVPTDEDADCFDEEAYLEQGPHSGDWFKYFELDEDFIAVINGGADDDDNGVNFLAGGQIGINQQYGDWVVGLEADASFLFGDDDQSLEFDYFHSIGCCGPDLFNYEGTGHVSGGDLDWLATFRARLGAALGDEGRFLLYGTGGLAIAGVNGLKGTFDDDPNFEFDGVQWCGDACVFGESDDDIRVGFAAGGGFEWAWTDTVSFGAEYLFVGFSDEGDSLTFYGDDGRQVSFENDLDHLHIARAKLNFRFPAP